MASSHHKSTALPSIEKGGVKDSERLGLNMRHLAAAIAAVTVSKSASGYEFTERGISQKKNHNRKISLGSKVTVRELCRGLRL